MDLCPHYGAVTLGIELKVWRDDAPAVSAARAASAAWAGGRPVPRAQRGPGAGPRGAAPGGVGGRAGRPCGAGCPGCLPGIAGGRRARPSSPCPGAGARRPRCARRPRVHRPG
ncbi:hypothetical protein THSYN_09595 [Candidatus Thiodictyon syntrophicum]|uniref:Uncharacterized protein n=1 Tax=Candidatus Thiodictyon syntrophicum TaxID=1166950 RepID=A0A2K8U6Y3_9GAMM|nr:hypothetical protein THSYN_09595 [Candidatus Thiodictyon syntrophicum]